MMALVVTPEDTWNAYRRHFYAIVSHFEHNIGRIIETFEYAGIGDGTPFVVTSGRGDYLGDHNLTGKSPPSMQSGAAHSSGICTAAVCPSASPSWNWRRSSRSCRLSWI